MQPFLLGALLLYLFRRGVWRIFPSFTLYVFLDLLNIPLMLMMRRQRYVVYFWTSWTYHLCMVVLMLYITKALIDRAFLHYSGFRNLGQTVFRWFAVLLLIAAVALSLMTNTHQPGPYVSIVLTLEQILRSIQVGLIVLLFCASSYLGLSLRGFTFGVALGFGFEACVGLLITTLFQHSTYLKIPRVLQSVDMAAYVIADCIWLLYLLKPASDRKPVSMPVSQLENWDLALTDLLPAKLASRK